MPYIRKADRPAAEARPCTVGELTFKLTQDCLRYLTLSGENQSFRDFAEVLGALEATKLELYRRRVAPYEDVKCKENGDVYDKFVGGSPAPA